ncbi:MAG: HEAT repeat domain-containing protein [Deltaproteobacteria bacterium]|nr:HEAT repeat domain-containing protein [Deltaproteobacteria bacterium]
MEPILERIAGMLGDERVERRCAAAMVLAEVRPKSAEVTEALARCLAEDHAPLRVYALEALAAMRATGIASAVAPLLDSPDEEVRARAAVLLASQGAKAAAALTRELDGAPLARRRTIVQILARFHSKDTFERLLKLLPDEELGDTVLTTLRGELEQMNDAEQKSLREAVAALLKNKSWMSELTGAARTVRLLGYFRDGKLTAAILPFLGDKSPVPVRVAALAALRRPLHAGKPPLDAVRELLRCAADADPSVARAAVDTLRGLPLPPEAAPALPKLAESTHSETRAYALDALGRTGDTKAVKTLIASLGSDDPTAREAAARALSRIDGAAGALVKELEAALGQPERLERLVRLLLPHATELGAAAKKTLAELALDALEADRPAAAPLLRLLKAADPQGLASLFTERALAHKKAKRFEQAFALMSRLEAAGLLDDEGHYVALVSGLCAHPGKKDLARASRTTDPVLKHAVALITAGFPVVGRLKKEKTVADEDLFFVGFNFVESKDEDEKELGGELLSHLAESSPRSKLGRSAKNKLRLVGLE